MRGDTGSNRGIYWSDTGERIRWRQWVRGTQLEWIQMARLAVTVLCSVLQESRGTAGAVEITGTTKVGKHTGKYWWGQAWFRNVNGRPDSEWLERACFWLVFWLQGTGAGNQNSGDCDLVNVGADDCGDWSDWDSLTLPPPPGATPDALTRWPGRPLGMGQLGRFRWNSSRCKGSRISSRATQDLFSGLYPSQSTRYSSQVLHRRESRMSRTW